MSMARALRSPVAGAAVDAYDRHVGRYGAELAREMRRLYPANPDYPDVSLRVRTTGKAELIPKVSDTLLKSVARNAHHLHMLRELGPNSLDMQGVGSNQTYVLGQGRAGPGDITRLRENLRATDATTRAESAADLGSLGAGAVEVELEVALVVPARLDAQHNNSAVTRRTKRSPQYAKVIARASDHVIRGKHAHH